MKEKTEKSGSTIRNLFLDFGDQEAAEAKEFLDGYLDIALDIYDAICRDPERYQRFRILTGGRGFPTLESNSRQPKTSLP